MSVGVIVADIPSGKILWRNTAAERILGPPAGPVSGAGDYARCGALHPDGSPYQAHEYPLARAVLDGEAIEREPMYYRRADGRQVWLEVNASRVRPLPGRQFGICTFQDVTAAYEARSALEEGAERVLLALDAGAILGTWMWNPSDFRLTADELFARSFGLDPAVCRIGLPPEEATATVHPADIASLNAAIAETLARGGAFRYQYRARHQDGLYRWIESRGRVETDASGHTRIAGVLFDITAQKQAEEARNLLMREVDHRARNVLTMVQSVVRLTDASDPRRYREEVVGRVDAMARAQASLARSNWQGGVLEDLIRDEISPYASPPNFKLAGPKITLPAEQVQPLNMILHELATNAVKHGGLSAPTGQVEISWAANRSGDVELTWQESGGPAVKPPDRKGFGSRLVERLAAQLGGSMATDWEPTGLIARLTWRA
jgi:PAS domain S-box-containing protein